MFLVWAAQDWSVCREGLAGEGGNVCTLEAASGHPLPAIRLTVMDGFHSVVRKILTTLYTQWRIVLRLFRAIGSVSDVVL